MATIPGLSYSLNLLCGAYASSFDVNIFLGPVPPTLNLSNPSILGSFVQSIWLEPALPSNSTNSSVAPASIASYPSTLVTSYLNAVIPTTSIADNSLFAAYKTTSYAPTVSIPSATPSASEGEVAIASVPSASPLPSNFTQDAKTASFNLTDSILIQHNLTRLSQLSTDIVVADLVANLTWVLGTPNSKTNNSSILPVVDVPIRFWVTSQQMSPETGKIRKQEILWQASENKLGGLKQGELPEVELQIQQANLDAELALKGQDADEPY